jgi:hypothetical protein
MNNTESKNVHRDCSRVLGRELRACPDLGPSPDLTGFGSGSEYFFLGSRSDPGTKIFLLDPDPSLVLTRSTLILAKNLNTMELKSTHNTFVLLFSTKRQLLIFGALIDTNKYQEMIAYRFFSLDDQL